MLKYFSVLLLGIAGALAFLYFRAGVPSIYREAERRARTAHFYDNPQKPLNQIQVVGVYFVPRDRNNSQMSNWQEVLEKSLEELQRFHELQLQNSSSLTYKIYSSPIIGREKGRFYDTDDTNRGNPEALRRAATEIEERLLTPVGDLWDKSFASLQTPSTTYRVLVILYEGVGASGAVGEPAALISRQYFTKSEYQTIGSSILAHEFYHTLGLPDDYEIPTAVPASSDIMGMSIGRFRPLNKTYLSRETLSHLGL